MHPTWESRIVRHADVAPGDLLSHPDNIKIHTDEQEADMVALLDRVGWAAAVLVSEKTGRIIDGHMRVNVAVRSGAATVPVDYVRLTDEEERKALLYLTRLPQFAQLDRVNLADVIDRVSTDEDAISRMADAFAKSSGLLRQQKLMAERETPQYMDITIGDFTLQISWPEYIHWRMGIQDMCKTRKNTINAEIRRRLGLEI
jgi:ParB-like chromosome segregation protein Spo0J